jgi:hypothetical protein
MKAILSVPVGISPEEAIAAAFASLIALILAFFALFNSSLLRFASFTFILASLSPLTGLIFSCSGKSL